jgi:hypothetical protein
MPNEIAKYTREQLFEIGMDNTQDKSDWQNLGILRFLKILFPEKFNNPFGELHYDMAQTFFSLFEPEREKRIDRQAYFLVHREAAKSTLASFGFVMFCILMNGKPIIIKRNNEYIKFRLDEKFIMIVSETSSSAEDFVTNVKEQLDVRKDLSKIFGEKSPMYIKSDDDRSLDKKWTKTIFKTADGIYVRGIGAGQQVRGRNLGGSRPTLCIIDDMYSENNTKTEARRTHIAHWFYNALLNSLDTIKGKCLWLGTQVHPDIVVKDFKESDDWFGIDKPIIAPEELQKLISICKSKGEFKIDREHLRSIQHQFHTLSWPTRYDLPYIAHLYKTNAIDKNMGDGFYREYMNQSVSPDNKSITENTFLKKDIEFYNSGTHTFIKFYEDEIEWEGACILNIGVDMGSSVKISSDSSVIICAGYARVYPKLTGRSLDYSLTKYKKGKIIPIILDCKYGKMDIFKYMDREGLYETILEMYEKYKINRIIIEANGQQALAVREIEKRFKEKGYYNKIIEEYVSVSKEERISSILKPIIQNYKHFYCQSGEYIKKLYIQTLLLGIGDHDDFPDALEECYKYDMKVPEIYPGDFQMVAEKEYEFNSRIAKDWYFM